MTDVYARALARLDEVEVEAQMREDDLVFEVSGLLRALLVERQALVTTVAMLNAAIRVVREFEPDLAVLWGEQVKVQMAAIAKADDSLREFAGGTG